MEIKISYELRPAIYTEKTTDKQGLVHSVEKSCLVHGAFQFSDGNESCPVFVIELEDGTVTDTYVGNVRFTNE